MRLDEIVSPRTLYHTTFRSRLPAIRKEGLVPGKRRVWKNRYGSTLGSNQHVHLFVHLEDAVRWAHKMNYEFDRPVAVLACQPPGPIEPHQNISVHQGIITDQPILPEAITGVIYPDRTLYRQIVNGGSITQPPTWQAF
jgi:hypothetical protein